MAELTWSDKLKIYADQLLRFAAKEPKEFLVTFFICISPLMLLCGYLSYLMIKQIDEKEKNKKKKATKSTNMAKTRRKVAKAD